MVLDNILFLYQQYNKENNMYQSRPIRDDEPALCIYEERLECIEDHQHNENHCSCMGMSVCKHPDFLADIPPTGFKPAGTDICNKCKLRAPRDH